MYTFITYYSNLCYIHCVNKVRLFVFAKDSIVGKVSTSFYQSSFYVFVCEQEIDSITMHLLRIKIGYPIE